MIGSSLLGGRPRFLFAHITSPDESHDVRAVGTSLAGIAFNAPAKTGSAGVSMKSSA
jgi:hypothetical protein